MAIKIGGNKQKLLAMYCDSFPSTEQQILQVPKSCLQVHHEIQQSEPL